MYDQLLSYRYHRLLDLNQGVNADIMVKLRLFMKTLDITMKEHHCDGSDMIMFFHFLINFGIEADKLNMSEGQPFQLT